MLMAVAGPVDQARAQPAHDPKLEEAILEQLDDLDARQYQTREAATRRLLQDQSLTPETMQALFKQADSPEQRHRLLTIALHHTIARLTQRQFADDEAGALGISHRAVRMARKNGPRRSGIRVTRVLPGFPAFAYLKPGDLIVEVDGQRLPSDVDGSEFARMIQNLAQDQQIRLTIRRRGNQRQVQFQLASAKALRTVYTGRMITLSFPYARRWEQAKARFKASLPSPAVLRP